MKYSLYVLLTVSLFGMLVLGCASEDSAGASDTDAGGDARSEAGADSDVNKDSDAEGDTNPDTADSDGDTDAGTDAGTDADTDVDTDVVTDTDPDGTDVDEWVFDGSSELTFGADGLVATFVLDDLNVFGDATPSGFYLVEDVGGSETETHLSDISFSGDQITVSDPGGAATFTLTVKGFGKHVAIHLESFDGVVTDALGVTDGLRLYVRSNDAVSYHIFNGLTEASAGSNNTQITVNWPYLWGRERLNGTNGSIVLYQGGLAGDELDAALAEIWAVQGTLGHMVHPAGQDKWTRATVLAWVNEWVELYGNIVKISVGADTPEELYELTNDYAIPLGVNRVYMFSNVWRVESLGMTGVREAIFPNGKEDMVAYSQYLESHGMNLQLKSLAPGINRSWAEYLSSDAVDDRIMRWWNGTLNGDIGTTDTTISVNVDAVLLPQDEIWSDQYMRIGNEMIQYESISKNGDVWTMTGCVRGFGGSEPHAHSAGTDSAGAVVTYNRFNFEDDFGQPNSLADEICDEWGEFQNDVGVGHIHFDGTNKTDYLPWYERDYTDAIYRLIDRPVTTSRVGGQIEAAFERYFSKAQAVYGSWGYSDLPVRLRLYEAGRSHTELSASVLDFHFDIADHLMRDSRRPSLLGGQSGSRLTLDMLETFGMTDQALELFGHWIELAPVFDDADMDYVSDFMTKDGNHWMSDDVLVLSKNSNDDYVFIPNRIMSKTDGDNNFDGVIDPLDYVHMDQEWGTIPRYQDISTGTTMELVNPYDAQPLQMIARLDFDTTAWQDPLITVNGSGTLSIDGDIQPGEYMQYEGGNSVNVYDENWNLRRTLTATASNFTVVNGNNTVTTAAGSGSSDVHTQFITLGPQYVLESNNHL